MRNFLRNRSGTTLVEHVLTALLFMAALIGALDAVVHG